MGFFVQNPASYSPLSRFTTAPSSLIKSWRMGRSPILHPSVALDNRPAEVVLVARATPAEIRQFSRRAKRH